MNTSGLKVVEYTYDAWGNPLTVTGSHAASLGHYNPLRYRGYLYDVETGLYYLQSRYYDPEIGRFLNADAFASTGQGLLGHNMFAYCGNNVVNRSDPNGELWGWVVGLVVVVVATLSGCNSDDNSVKPRQDLANAPDLNVDTADPGTYNCYGNGIGKQIVANPTGYKQGDSTRKTFEAVKKDLGVENVRELDSIDSPIMQDEFLVAIKCGPTDYHFIRLTSNGWYNKSEGNYSGLYIDEEWVRNDTWMAMAIINGSVYVGEPYYTYETIYFAVKVGWDK